MKMNLFTKFLFASLFLATQLIWACAADKNPSGTCDCRHHLRQITKNLSLSDEQKIKIQALKTQTRANLKNHMEQLNVIKPQIKALIVADKMDAVQLDKLIAEKNRIRAILMKNRIILQHQIYSLLTTEQKAKFKELL